MADLERIKVFSVAGKSYELRFPTVAEFMDIEAKKMSLSGGKYNAMMFSGSKSSLVNLDLIDMAAVLPAIAPDEFMKNMRVGSLLDLSLDDSVQLVAAYKEQVEDWVNSWVELFRGVTLPKLNEEDNVEK